MKTLTKIFTDNNELRKHFISFVTDGGIFVETSELFELGEEVSLSLKLPDSHDVEIVMTKVIWITPANSQHNTCQGIGLSFTDAKLKMRQQIERLLSNLLSSTEATLTM